MSYVPPGLTGGRPLDSRRIGIPRSTPRTCHTLPQPRSRRVRPRLMVVAGEPPRPEATKAKDIGWFKKIGQSFNPSGIAMFGRVLQGGGILALPHVTVPDIAHVAWPKLKEAGFKGCVFDKDNTLTEPYAEMVAPQLASALEQCKRTFPDRVVLFSNSAGLQEFDPDGEEAAKVGKALGIPVLTHVDKKPGGEATELEAYFGCKARDLVMVGDRYLTDIVFGNRLGMLTVRTAPLTLRGEPKAVLLARRIEDNCVHRWQKHGKTAPPHPLASPAILPSFVLDDATYNHPGLKTPPASAKQR